MGLTQKELDQKAELIFSQYPKKDGIWLTTKGRAFWTREEADAAESGLEPFHYSRKKLAAEAGLEKAKADRIAQQKAEVDAKVKAEQETKAKAAEEKVKAEQEAKAKEAEEKAKAEQEAKAKEAEVKETPSPMALPLKGEKGTALLASKPLNRFTRDELADLLNEWDIDFDLADKRPVLMTKAVTEKKNRQTKS